MPGASFSVMEITDLFIVSPIISPVENQIIESICIIFSGDDTENENTQF